MFEKNTVTTGNLGAVTYALQSSFSLLGIEMILPPPNGKIAQEFGEMSLRSELCHPLKMFLGNFLSVKDYKVKNVIFYTGCDICNLPSSANVYLDIFKDYSWSPKCHYLDIADKKNFIKDFYKILKTISGANDFDVIKAMLVGLKKFFFLEDLDKAFYFIRPGIGNFAKGEKIYEEILNEIINENDFSSFKKTEKKIKALVREYYPDVNLPYIGIIGDSYSMLEPFSHQYTDKTLGSLGVICDRWLVNPWIKKQKTRKIDVTSFIKNDYGALMKKEIKKTSLYLQKRYDGLVFISPFSCNPCDAFKSQLSVIQDISGIPILSLSFDSHTSSTGLQSRLEAFVDLVGRKKRKNF